MKLLYLRPQVMPLPHFGPVAAFQCLLRRISGVMTFSDFRLRLLRAEDVACNRILSYLQRVLLVCPWV
jgi:hypothetical protein